MAPILSITYCGETLPSSGWSYPTGYLERSAPIWLHHWVKSGSDFLNSVSKAGISAVIASPTSPTIATSAKRFLPISAGSISA
ncbi:unannotated protein [freshwater metagenome]|uniref:Unannotated protein n=1 Tax=freshwater metagenome TaxID=449393 RepID=A0A6J6YJK7_9ZZZZ